MNKTEAIKAMLQGQRVTHYMWKRHKFIRIEDGWIYNENNERLESVDEFNKSLIADWAHDWSIWKEL